MAIIDRSIEALEKEVEELEAALFVPKEDEEGEEALKEASPAPKPPEPDEGNWAKRYADLRRLSSKRDTELADLKAQLADREKSSSAPDISTVEEAEEWINSNPKAASIIKVLFHKEASVVLPKMDDIKKLQEELTTSKEKARALKAHADFEEITSSVEFHGWANKQPPVVQRAIFEGDTEDAIWAVSAYKETLNNISDNGKSAAKAIVNKNTGSEPSGLTGKGRFSESQVQSMTLKEYEKHEDAIVASQKDGSFVYDLSGGAR